MRQIRALFVQRATLALKLIQDAHRTDASGVYVATPAEREAITNAGFMRLFIALEEFLEAAFLHYAMGRMSTRRWRASRYLRPASEEHAHNLFVGTQRFVDWSTPDVVRKLANLYFVNGEPFDGPITGAHQHWLDMKTVRNATAHVSRTTQVSLDALHTRWTGTPTVNTTAYSMLMANRVGSTDSFLSISDRTVQNIVASIADR